MNFELGNRLCRLSEQELVRFAHYELFDFVLNYLLIYNPF